MSTDPNSSTVRRTSASTDRRSVTSVGTTSVRPGRCTRSTATSSSFARFREARTTFALFAASSRAVSRPIPEDAPVTMAVRPAMRMWLPLLDRALPEPLSDPGPQAANGVLARYQAHVPALQDDFFFVIAADDVKERPCGRERRDVVVFGHCVEYGASDALSVHLLPADGHRPLEELDRK